MDFIFATRNEGKMREIRAIFADAGLTVGTLADANLTGDPIEDGETFAANAVKKATFFLPQASCPILADDSGLEIDALQKRPGVHSARWLGADTPYTEKNARVLAMLADVPDAARTARYVCVIACAWPDGTVWDTYGAVEGQIARQPAGAGGFGYDPIFWLPAYGMTMAQLDPAVKNTISHRGVALRAMLARITAQGGAL